MFSDDWDEYFFDNDGDDFSLFNADIVIGSEADEDGTVVLMKGHVVSEYDAEKDRYTRTIKVIVGEQELEVPMLVETKTYLDDNGSFRIPMLMFWMIGHLRQLKYSMKKGI